MNRAIAWFLAAPSLVACATTAFCDDIPRGWSHSQDGSYTHAESGVVCPTSFEGFAFLALAKSRDANSVGDCEYGDSQGRIAEIRIRKYVRGVGDTPLAIQNDESLMEPSATSGLPPGAKLMGAYRLGPGPEINGESTLRDVATITRRNLLIDCMAWERKSLFVLHDAIQKFPIICVHMAPDK